MIIDIHFHAFPKKYLELVPEQSRSDVRGVGFRAFDHQEYLNVMDQYGIDIGVLSNTGGRIEQGGDRRRRGSSALSSTMLLPKLMPSTQAVSKPLPGCRWSTWTIASASSNDVSKISTCMA